MYFWLPSGAASIIVSTVFTLVYLDILSEKYKKVLKIPNHVSWDRGTLKEDLMNAEEYTVSHRIYLDLVKKLHDFLVKIDHKVHSAVNIYFIACLLLLLFINFGYWYFTYLVHGAETFGFLQENALKKIFPDEKMQTAVLKFYKDYGEIFLNYTASFIMFFNALSLFVVLSVIRWIQSRKDKRFFFCLDLCFFRLPDHLIFLYIPVATAFVGLFFYKFFEPYKYLLSNIIIIFSFFYFLNGTAIVRVYTKIRFLPFGSLLLISFIVSLFIPEILLLMVAAFFLIGLFDFAFDLRKKALHHASLREN